MSISDMLGVSSDLLVDLTTLLIPYNVDTMPALCDIYIVVKMTLMNAANMFILLMSVERVYATYYPFRYKQNVTLGLMYKTGLFCLILSFMSSLSIVATHGAVDGYCFDTRKGGHSGGCPNNHLVQCHTERRSSHFKCSHQYENQSTNGKFQVSLPFILR